MIDKNRRNLALLRRDPLFCDVPFCDVAALLRRDPQFCEAERHIRGLQPALSEYETALAALKWLARFEGETVDALASANPGLAQPQ